jgi:hypothetical protein
MDQLGQKLLICQLQENNLDKLGSQTSAAIAAGGEPVTSNSRRMDSNTITFPARKSRTSFLQFYIKCF